MNPQLKIEFYESNITDYMYKNIIVNEEKS